MKYPRLRYLIARSWQLKYLFEMGVSSWINHSGIVVLTFLTQHPSKLEFQLWIAVILAISISMGILSFIMSAKARSYRSLKLGGWVHSALTLGAGLSWGWGAILSANLDADRFLIYTLALGGTALGVVSSQHSVLRSALLSIWSAILLLAFAHFTSPQLEGSWMTPAMMLVYGLVLTVMAVRMHRFVSANHALAKQLRQRVHTEKRLTQKYLQEQKRATSANLAKSRFLAHASHDLRQSVQAIAVLAENLEAAEGRRNAQKLIKGLKSSVASLADLMKSLLDLSALDLGKIQPDIKPVEIKTLFERLESLNKEVARHAGCDLRFVRSTIKVKSDPNLLLNIVQNLLSNAYKHAHGARILVGIKRRANTVSLCVLDQGPGISPERHELVFSEFYRGEETQGVTEGLGLGLTLVGKYAELLRISVRLKSDVEKGVCVELAALEVTQEDVPPQEFNTVAQHKLSGFKVSVLAKQTDALSVYLAALEKWGGVVSLYETLDNAIGSGDPLLVDVTSLTVPDYQAEVSIAAAVDVVAITDQIDQTRARNLFNTQSLHVLDRAAPVSKLRALLTSIAMQ